MTTDDLSADADMVQIRKYIFSYTLFVCKQQYMNFVEYCQWFIIVRRVIRINIITNSSSIGCTSGSLNIRTLSSIV